MAQLSRVRRTSRTIRFFVLVALLGTVTQSALSPNRMQTRLFGASRLVSVEPLPEAAGELCFETQDTASSAAMAREIFVIVRCSLVIPVMAVMRRM